MMIETMIACSKFHLYVSIFKSETGYIISCWIGQINTSDWLQGMRGGGSERRSVRSACADSADTVKGSHRQQM